MADLPSVLIIIAVLFCVTALVQPLAQRLRLSYTVLLALVGVLIGAGSAFLLATPLTNLFNVPAELILGFPVTSQVFLFVFLPVLLFQASLTLDVRRIAEEAAPILLMAVVAVVVTTAVVGFALEPFAGVPLAVCLMLGAIVATTDPAAVVAIFRDLGAPARLSRLVEGESLLNDATAIAIFTALLAFITAADEPEVGETLAGFGRSFGGGLLVGLVSARGIAALLPLVRDIRTAEVTLTVALPYLAYIVSERYLGVSGVTACVTAGLLLGAIGRTRVSPRNWRFLEEIWEQIAFWAGSLVFILAAILVPRLLTGLGWREVGLVALLVLACLVARALVLFLLLPLLSWLRLGQAVSTPYKVVILWGGLRGAVTLALALAVTENPVFPPEVQRFVAILATGYVLFTLLVNGTTLRPLIRLLGLDRLSPLDQALRRRVVALSLVAVRDAVERAATAYHIPPEVAAEVARPYADRIAAAGDDREEAIADRDRLNIALVALAGREREALLEHFHRKTASPHVLEAMLQQSDRLVEAARRGGRSEYNREARHWLGFGPAFVLATALHRHLRVERMLANRLADRFETLLVSRIVLEDLRHFAAGRLATVLGERLAGLVGGILTHRIDATNRALEALWLQYPHYARAMQRRFLRQYALRLEEAEHTTLLNDGLIGQELYHNLLNDVAAEVPAATARPRLDIRLDGRTLIEQFPLFSNLSEAQVAQVAALLSPRFARPGERLMARGERADGMFFIASGAVEIATGDQRVRLGRGDFFGEMGLLGRRRRAADVTALVHCHLLELGATDFRALLKGNPELALRIRTVAEDRRRMNQADAARRAGPTTVPPDRAVTTEQGGFRT
ncbi:cation:proton antiporter [Rhodospirillum centenum]|uniref:Sodium/hydrogen exchanger family protein n=1 Tax=Rhodospirillum centenum (strain ATCC 51521 / SW) TaxID=414684 RepID=B6IUK1_RHOCS|nr:cation:proton antiporter [Rhodospirillum centenum]ACI99826.1 sodium/hydrogen exchanger family protein [Rhodospirillum centenum SW]